MQTLSPDKPKWILNCPSERAEAIMAVSPHVLVTGPPVGEGGLSSDDLFDQGLVGLYRTDDQKEAGDLARGRRDYLESIDRDELLSTGRARLILKSMI
jgi:hypothetical protein